MSIGDGACDNLGLDEAVHDAAPAEHHAVMGLPGNQEEQAAVGAIGVRGVKEFCGDERLLSLWTGEDRFQTWSQHRDLIVDGIHLETDPLSGPPWLGRKREVTFTSRTNGTELEPSVAVNSMRSSRVSEPS